MRTKRSKQRGSGLLLAMFFLILLLVMATAYMQLIPTELTSAKRTQFDIQGAYAADAGLIAAIAYMEEEITNGREPVISAAGYTSPVKTIHSGKWDYKFTIIPDAETPPLGPNSQRIYKVTSDAVLDGRSYRTVEAWVAQDTWAKYAFFMETGFGGWMGVTDRVTGPMHSNEKLKISVPSGFNYDAMTQPTFLGETTFSQIQAGSADGVEYDRNPPYSWTGAKNAYNQMLAGGRDDLHSETVKKMPTNQNSIGKAAWFGNTYSGSVPTVPSNGITMNSGSTGVYIKGNVDEMYLSVDANGNSVTDIKQNSVSTIPSQVINLNGNYTIPANSLRKGSAAVVTSPELVTGSKTVIKRPAAGGKFEYEIIDGGGNGVFFVDGNIDSLAGKNKGRKTIATSVDLAAGKKGRIEITNDITRDDTPIGTEPTGDRDGLGLVAYDIALSSTAPRLGSADPLDLYCLLFAGVSTSTSSEGGLVVENYASGPWGKFIVHGAFIQAVDGPWGYISGGLPSTGFSSYAFNFDSELARNPPPFFPTTTKFVLRSYLSRITHT